jgi:hypothetical protein
MEVLRSFHGDIAIKEKYLARIKAHLKAGEIVQGFGFIKTAKGCKCGAIGCTIDQDNPKKYEKELGFPVILARLKDLIFEGLSLEECLDFPLLLEGKDVPGNSK